jgi:hypothetical protein
MVHECLQDVQLRVGDPTVDVEGAEHRSRDRFDDRTLDQVARPGR